MRQKTYSISIFSKTIGKKKKKKSTGYDPRSTRIDIFVIKEIMEKVAF